MDSTRFIRSAIWILALSAVAGTSCRRMDPPAPKRAAAPRAVDAVALFSAERVGRPAGKPPWVAHVTTTDLDRDGRMDILACEAQENVLLWLRQVDTNHFEETVLAADLKGLVRAVPVDLDGDGDLDVLVACMGYVFPNNDKIGSLIALENDGKQHFTARVLLEHVARVNDVVAADLTGDGRLDLGVAQFGFDQGEVRWMENLGDWRFRSHPLLELSGAINVVAADFNGDRRVDLAVQISQQWEEIYLFENQGEGQFQRRRIWGSTNEDYGSSGMVAADLNRDGRPDLVFTNGDGFGPAAVPGPRPWHGVQWLENRGQGFFQHHAIGHLDGAYSPLVVDLDRDGALDVVAVSAFVEKDSAGRPLPSLAWYRNDGSNTFQTRVLAYAPQHQITVCSADLDGSGNVALVTGGFYVFSPSENMGRLTLWRRADR